MNRNLEPRHSRLGVGGWALYDWANSAFGTVITTFVFAPYFIAEIAPNATRGTVLWGQASGTVALTVALLGPFLGAVCDEIGPRKPWIMAFTGLCAAGASLLIFSEPSSAVLVMTLVFFVLAAIGSDMALVFYNAMLPHLAPRGYFGRLSGWGWALGYIGGMASLGATLALPALVAPFDPDGEAFLEIRAAGPMIGVWYLLFALPLFVFTPDVPRKKVKIADAVARGGRRLANTIMNLRRYNAILRFLLVFLFVSNGLVTIFTFAGVYAAGTFGMTIEQITLFGLVLNIAAGAGAFAFSWVDDWLGPKRTLLFSLLALTGTGLVLVTTSSTAVFVAVGLVMSIFIGPAQSACRSYMARIVPRDMVAEMFGFYALSGKMTAFFGPLLLAWVTSVFQSQRAGMASILVFFIAGLWALRGVRDPASRQTL